MEFVLPSLLFAFSFVLEAVTYAFLPQLDKAKYSAIAANAIMLFSATSYVVLETNIFTVILMALTFFRVVNNARVLVARMHPKALKRRYKRSGLWLGAMTLLAFGAFHFMDSPDPLSALVLLSLLGSVILLVQTAYSLMKWRYKPTNEQLEKVPVISVCIPARNETVDLPECLDALLASKYPKLEILVLDDCSHDKTPEILKQYAHKGVRFLKGTEPSKGWLAKNQAMNKLFDESKGEIVVFAGVDVRLEPDSLSKLLLTMDGKDMVSVLPRRSSDHETSVFIQPLRYWWELSVPKLLKSRPPTLSTLWAVRRSKLQKSGEFEGFKNSVQAEAHFAKRFGSEYSFILAGRELGITSKKGRSEQSDTALRIRYPQAKRRPEFIAIILALELIVYVSPVVGLIIGLSNEETALTVVSSVSLAILITINTAISILTVRNLWFIGLLSLPFLMLQEWYLLIRSMLAYEFGVVKWKDRNICLPMLKAERSLPKL